MPAGTLHYTFTGSNVYDTDIYGTDGTLALDRVGSRESNLNYDLSKGVSVEFWLNKSTWLTSSTEKEVVFDLWNGSISSSAGYGRFLHFIFTLDQVPAQQTLAYSPAPIQLPLLLTPLGTIILSQFSQALRGSQRRLTSMAR